MSILFCRAAAVAGVMFVLAGCQSVPLDYKPDPALKSETPEKLQARVAAACVKSQRAKSSLQSPQLRKSCGCYAAATFKAMNEDELVFYRGNGYFNDSTRTKGQTALNACGLK